MSDRVDRKNHDGQTDRDARSLASVLDRLIDEGLLTRKEREAAVGEIDTWGSEDGDPWYVKFVSGLGAWLAAMTFVGFLGCSNLLELEGASSYVTGTLFLVTGVLLYRNVDWTQIFFSQLALAGSLVGQTILVATFTETADLPGAALGYGLLVVPPLYWLYDSGVHRFLTSVAALTMGAAAFGEVQPVWGQTVLFGVELAAIGAIFSGGTILPLGWRVWLRPFGYAAVVSVIWSSSAFFLLDYLEMQTLVVHRGLAAATLLYLAYEAVREGGSEWLEAAFWGGAAAVALAVFSTPGLLVAMIVLFLGLWRGSAALSTLGVVSLAYYLWAFYYSIDMTLLAKSGVLVASGAILLALRWWFARRPWSPGGST